MEKNSNGKRIGPLPGGDRWGTFVAGVGRGRMLASDSRRTGWSGVGDRGVRESPDATADETTGVTLRSREVSPASSAGTLTSTTSSIKDDARRTWSQAELEELMFCYYRARLGGSGYIKRLEKIFKDRNTHNPKARKFTGNTLSNQVRSILSRRCISTEILEDIKRRAERSHSTPDMSESRAQLDTNQHTDTNTTDILPLPTTQLSDTQQHDITLQPDTPTQHTYENTQQTFTLVQSEANTQQTNNTLENETVQEIEVNEDQDPVILEFLQKLSEIRQTPIQDRQFLPKPNFNKHFIRNLNTINKYLPNLLTTHESLREVNDIIYATAKTLITLNQQTPYTPPNVHKPRLDPPWKRRLKQRIEDIRKELGRLVEIKSGANSRRMANIKQKLYEKHKITNQEELNNTIEILKQKVKALAGRLRRYDEINERKIQNKLFVSNQHTFYKSLSNTQDTSIQIPA